MECIVIIGVHLGVTTNNSFVYTLYFKLFEILTEFPDKFGEYHRMNTETLDYIMDSAKDILQGYSAFRKCNEAEGELIIAVRYVLDIAVRKKYT